MKFVVTDVESRVRQGTRSSRAGWLAGGRSEDDGRREASDVVGKDWKNGRNERAGGVVRAVARVFGWEQACH